MTTTTTTMSRPPNTSSQNSSWNWSFCPSCGNALGACSCAGTGAYSGVCLVCRQPSFSCLCISEKRVPHIIVNTQASTSACPTCSVAWPYCRCSYVRATPFQPNLPTSTSFTSVPITWSSSEFIEVYDFVDVLGQEPLEKITCLFCTKDKDLFSACLDQLLLPASLSAYFFKLPQGESIQIVSPMVFSGKTKDKQHFFTLTRVGSLAVTNERVAIKSAQLEELSDNLQYLRLASRDLTLRKELGLC